jgi:hypothetical protein
MIGAVTMLLVATSGCSVKEVQLWFRATNHGTVTSDQAKAIADVVNPHQPVGCDPRYSPGTGYATSCVPSNVATVDCAGTTGDGPAVRGPLVVTGWDSFDLDPDGDRNACVDPVGSVDVVGQVDDHIAVAGWAFDPNAPLPINVFVVDNGTSNEVAEMDSRPDVAAMYPGQGTLNGFSATTATSTSPFDGTAHQICVTAQNYGAGADTALGCKTIVMREPGIQEVGTGLTADFVDGLIEGADHVPGGIHIRGYLVDENPTPGTSPTVNISPFASRPDISITDQATATRSDIAAKYGVPDANVQAFDFVQPTTGSAGAPFGSSSVVCLFAGPDNFPPGPIMCRDLDS